MAVWKRAATKVLRRKLQPWHHKSRQPVFLHQRPKIPLPPLVQMAASAPSTPKIVKTFVLPMVLSSVRFARLDATKTVILLSVWTAVLRFVMRDLTQFLKVASKSVAHKKQ